MRILALALPAALAALSPLAAQPGGLEAEARFPDRPQLVGIGEDDAAHLVAELKEAQAALASGGTPSFALLSGAPSYYDAARISPRDAFLALDWGKTLTIAAMKPERPSWAGYRLSVMPDGLGRLFWDVRVWRNGSGNLERIELFYGPPPPF